jgi:inhibitor of Bruton tyrosine kinase
MQRVTNVCANNAGAFGALRMDFKPKSITMTGNTLTQDLTELQPYLQPAPFSLTDATLDGRMEFSPGSLPFFGDDEDEDTSVRNDTFLIRRLYSFLRDKDQRDTFHGTHLPYGADLILQLPSGLSIPVHRVILAARAPVFCDVLSGVQSIRSQDATISIRLVHVKRSPATRTPIYIACTGCHAVSILLLLTYLYSDEIPALWDRLVSSAFHQESKALGVDPIQIKVELQALARVLKLPLLSRALESPAKRSPLPSLVADMARLFDLAQNRTPGNFPATINGFGKTPLYPDVILQLSDKDMLCHSVILRARSPFFASFFGDEDWTVNRWDADGTIKIDMRHMDERIIHFVLRFLYGDEELFVTLGRFFLFEQDAHR